MNDFLSAVYARGIDCWCVGVARLVRYQAEDRQFGVSAAGDSAVRTPPPAADHESKK